MVAFPGFRLQVTSLMSPLPCFLHRDHITLWALHPLLKGSMDPRPHKSPSSRGGKCTICIINKVNNKKDNSTGPDEYYHVQCYCSGHSAPWPGDDVQLRCAVSFIKKFSLSPFLTQQQARSCTAMLVSCQDCELTGPSPHCPLNSQHLMLLCDPGNWQE